MAARAIWIVGTPFSGSTMVQQLVGRFDKVLVAGEIDRIRAFNMHPHLEDDPKCYLDECAYCKARDEACPIWTPDVFAALGESGIGPGLYEVLSGVAGKEVVVDASKTPWWFLNVGRHPSFADWVGRLLVIHSVRHPFAYAVSYANRASISLEQCVQDWVLINRDAVDVVRRYAAFAPVLTVYHNRVLEDPAGLMRALANWADLGSQEEGRTLHFLGGNTAAWPFTPKDEQTNAHFEATRDYFRRVDARTEGDGRWRSKIDHGMRWRLAGLPGVRDMCAAFGIDIDGLIAS